MAADLDEMSAQLTELRKNADVDVVAKVADLQAVDPVVDRVAGLAADQPIDQCGVSKFGITPVLR